MSALVALVALAAPAVAHAGSFTFKPAADAYVTAANPDLNSGLSVDLSASPSPDRRSYLRFTIAGLDGPVSKATLRLMPTAAAPVGYEVRGVPVVSWLETGITYNNAPAPNASVTATSGPLTTGTWSTADVTSLVPGNSTITLAVTSADLTRIWLASRETATAPELVVETNTAPPPNDTTPPPTPTIDSQPSNPSAVGDAQFSFSDTEGGVTFACTLDTGTATPCTSPKSYAGLASGSHTFSVTAADAAGNVSPAASYTWTVDLPPPPPPPAGTSFAPVADTFVSAGAPDTNNGASVDLTASVSPDRRSYLRFNVQGLPVGTSVSRATLRLWTTAPSATGYEVHGVSSNTWGELATTYNNAPAFSAAVTSTSGGFATGMYASADVTQLVAGNGLVSFAITTGDANRAWFSSRETANAPQLIVETATDTTAPPAPTIDTKPANPTTSSDATFAFSDSEAGVTYTCTLDTGAAAACASPKTFTGLASGAHTFSVTAKDAAGNVSPSATYTWTVNLLPRVALAPVADAFVSAALPDTNNGPSVDLTASASPDRRSYLRFDVKGVKGTVSRATLRLWGTAAAPVGYEVRGVASATWAESTVTYNNAPPVGTTVAGTSGPVAAGAYADADVTSLVKGNGLLSLAITTTDATRNWFASRETATPPQLVIEYVADTTPPPAPTIDSKPADPSNTSSASFGFSDTEAGVTFLCSLDGAAFAACTSPQSYSALTEASHTFSVKAADAAGNESPVTSYTWRISIPVTSATGTFTPVADAYVVNDTKNRSKNFGSSLSLQAEAANPLIRSYVKFNVQNVGAVSKATLRLRATITSSNGFQIRGVTDTTWGESTITYTNSPAMSTTITADSGPFSNGTWLSLDVTPLIKGNGLVTLGIASLKSSGLTLASRETGANSPQLVVASQAKQDLQPPPTPTITSGPSNPTSSTTATFNFTDTEAGVTFLCQLDAGAFAACTSPKTYSALAVTGHSFGVKARDAAGNDSPVALFSWTINNADPIVAAVGDIACDPLDVNFNNGLGTATNCVQQKTADLAASVGATAVLPLGDIQYNCSGLTAYQQSYDKSWGKLKSISRPTIGNHEYDTSGGTGCDTTGTASGYFDYFGTAAGPRGKGYYSYDIGGWHLVALNSECTHVSCAAGSAQEQWLRSDLAASTKKCTLAYWHTPRYASGGGETPGLDALWKALYDYNAELVLSGHMHWYERFAPQGPAGALNTTRGLRQFIVGTGGKSLHTYTGTAPNSEIRNMSTYGVMKVTLHATSYDWKFLPANGGTFTDSGTTACH